MICLANAIQQALLLGFQRLSICQITVNPSHQNYSATGLTNTMHFGHELCFPRHVLTTFQRPNQIKRIVGKWHLQCIGHLKAA
mmetsp:Transcript_46673/g.57322  ORF Transcript_46673/g.57322 Transcript_46673/m.57322 type:complete len:83 (+) Transcript_46673:348-596(+)